MDNWNILVESREDGFTIATVLEVPNLQTTDATKQGAIEKVRQLLKERLAKAEIIQIYLPKTSKDGQNYIMEFAGIFTDDSDFQDIMSAIRAEREDESEL